LKTLVIAAFALAATTAADAEEDLLPPLVLASPAAITARLAEYLTSCGGKAKPEVEQVALRIIKRMDYQKWLETASSVHLVRDEAMLKNFCLDTRAELNDLLEPIEYSPHEDKPPPGELDLSRLKPSFETALKPPTLASQDGGNGQMFGAKQQDPHGGKGD
jgi:hypothetical protein